MGGGGGEGGREVASEQHTKGGASVRGGRSLGRSFSRAPILSRD